MTARKLKNTNEKMYIPSYFYPLGKNASENFEKSVIISFSLKKNATLKRGEVGGDA